MHVETQTKRLARTVFLFSASSLCAVLVSLAVTHQAKAVAPQTANFLVYTYQKPFNVADNASSAVSSRTKIGSVLIRLFSVKFLLGLSGLGALWLASTWYLHRGGKAKKRMHRQISSSTSAQMNPLAILPVIRVQKQDTFCPPVSCRPATSRSLAHRKTTAPCQSRFRPITLAAGRTRLAAGQNRFGRL
jgi:hypothetical protein